MAHKTQTKGFGFVSAESEHHFLVTIPASKKGWVYISEHFVWKKDEHERKLNVTPGREDDKMRVILPYDMWGEIADATKAEFNQRLRKSSMKTGQWRVGQTPVERLFGKELVLLAWAIEDADPSLIQVAIRNWQGLAPEERWWLFTMTNAATGHALSGRNKGWRKAVRYALTENPVSGFHLYTPKHAAFLLVPAPSTRETCICTTQESQAESVVGTDMERAIGSA
jgi:hypothetical protein